MLQDAYAPKRVEDIAWSTPKWKELTQLLEQLGCSLEGTAGPPHSRSKDEISSSSVGCAASPSSSRSTSLSSVVSSSTKRSSLPLPPRIGLLSGPPGCGKLSALTTYFQAKHRNAAFTPLGFHTNVFHTCEHTIQELAEVFSSFMLECASAERGAAACEQCMEEEEPPAQKWVSARGGGDPSHSWRDDELHLSPSARENDFFSTSYRTATIIKFYGESVHHRMMRLTAAFALQYHQLVEQVFGTPGSPLSSSSSSPIVSFLRRHVFFLLHTSHDTHSIKHDRFSSFPAALLTCPSVVVFNCPRLTAINIKKRLYAILHLEFQRRCHAEDLETFLGRLHSTAAATPQDGGEGGGVRSAAASRLSKAQKERERLEKERIHRHLIREEVLQQLVEGCAGDLRHALNQLQFLLLVPPVGPIPDGLDPSSERARRLWEQLQQREGGLFTPYAKDKNLASAVSMTDSQRETTRNCAKETVHGKKTSSCLESNAEAERERGTGLTWMVPSPETVLAREIETGESDEELGEEDSKRRRSTFEDVRVSLFSLVSHAMDDTHPVQPQSSASLHLITADEPRSEEWGQKMHSVHHSPTVPYPFAPASQGTEEVIDVDHNSDVDEVQMPKEVNDTVPVPSFSLKEEDDLHTNDEDDDDDGTVGEEGSPRSEPRNGSSATPSHTSRSSHATADSRAPLSTLFSTSEPPVAPALRERCVETPLSSSQGHSISPSVTPWFVKSGNMAVARRDGKRSRSILDMLSVAPGRAGTPSGGRLDHHWIEEEFEEEPMPVMAVGRRSSRPARRNSHLKTQLLPRVPVWDPDPVPLPPVPSADTQMTSAASLTDPSLSSFPSVTRNAAGSPALDPLLTSRDETVDLFHSIARLLTQKYTLADVLTKLNVPSRKLLDYMWYNMHSYFDPTQLEAYAACVGAGSDVDTLRSTVEWQEQGGGSSRRQGPLVLSSQSRTNDDDSETGGTLGWHLSQLALVVLHMSYRVYHRHLHAPRQFIAQRPPPYVPVAYPRVREVHRPPPGFLTAGAGSVHQSKIPSSDPFSTSWRGGEGRDDHREAPSRGSREDGVGALTMEAVEEWPETEWERAFQSRWNEEKRRKDLKPSHHTNGGGERGSFSPSQSSLYVSAALVDVIREALPSPLYRCGSLEPVLTDYLPYAQLIVLQIPSELWSVLVQQQGRKLEWKLRFSCDESVATTLARSASSTLYRFPPPSLHHQTSTTSSAESVNGLGASATVATAPPPVASALLTAAMNSSTSSKRTVFTLGRPKSAETDEHSHMVRSGNHPLSSAARRTTFTMVKHHKETLAAAPTREVTTLSRYPVTALQLQLLRQGRYTTLGLRSGRFYEMPSGKEVGGLGDAVSASSEAPRNPDNVEIEEDCSEDEGRM